MSRLPDLRELVNREFFDLWLAKISEISEKLPSSVDPQMASFTCQLAVAACLKEAGLSSGSREADLDFGMELVRTLWAITPMGAKSRIRPEVLEAMTPVSWRDPISAWHNFRAAGLGAAFIASIKDLYKENYPLLTDEDAGVLAQLSP